jgi:AcrR family transcriptional regulator
MPRVSQAYLDARRAQILEAAIACFAREGFHRATIQDIVEQSGLSPGAIYNYFESKEEIIEAIADERHAKERALIAHAQEPSSVAEGLEQLRKAFFAPLSDPKERRRRRVGIQLWAEAQRSPRIHRIVRRGVDDTRRQLGALIAKAQRRGEIPRELEADALARMMIAVFQGFVLQIEWDAKARIEPYVEVLDLCMRRLLEAGSRRKRAQRIRK